MAVRQEAEVHALYGEEPVAFVRRRDAIAARLADDGDELAAARIRRLAAPTEGAYWVNQLARRWPQELAALLDVGERLRARLAAGSPDDLTDLEGERRVKTDALVALLWYHGESQAASGHHSPSPETLALVAETLRSAVVSADVAAAVRSGTLAETVALVSGVPLGLTGATPARGPAGPLALQRATSDLVAAEKRLDAVRETIDSLAGMVTDLQEQLDRLTRDRDKAATSLALWRRSETEAAQRLQEARSHLAALVEPPNQTGTTPGPNDDATA
ncbi:hypothetical protein [Serinibacter salmoneus]|uniref:Uncharacterized protein n=1 Tax=Serinibacter salmoneus TaxID=556530 RepID=A0A2A9D1F5_9MICO|nr:hypothetical protein [Serinibacter salmoneus]PFG20186.1 hypothetical protein ATL40_1775 [Serinibacter salmoneus]